MQTENEQLILKRAKQSEADKKWREKNKAKISEYNKFYAKKNKDKIAKSQKINRENNKEKTKEYNKLYRENNKEKIAKQKNQYFKLNKKIIDENAKKYIIENKEIINKKRKIYYDKNIVKIKQYYNTNKQRINTRQRERKQTNPLFKLKCNLSTRINSSLKAKNFIKSQRTLEMIGCDLKTIKAHLEKQFTKGMNWENQGKWHVDHIIPCASAKTEEELIKLFHYTNFQPLWAIDNFSKGDKIIEKQLFLL